MKTSLVCALAVAVMPAALVGIQQRRASLVVRWQDLQRLGGQPRASSGSNPARSSPARSPAKIDAQRVPVHDPRVQGLRAPPEREIAGRRQGQRGRPVSHQANPQPPRSHRVPSRHGHRLVGRAVRRIAPQESVEGTGSGEDEGRDQGRGSGTPTSFAPTVRACSSRSTGSRQSTTSKRIQRSRTAE